jgi:hypothetical protein
VGTAGAQVGRGENVGSKKAVLSDEMDQAPAGVIFQDIRRVIREFFLHFECSYVPRLVTRLRTR